MGNKLRDRIAVKGISQAEFAVRMGVTPQYVTYLIRCVKKPSVELLKRMADELGCKMDDLV